MDEERSFNKKQTLLIIARVCLILSMLGSLCFTGFFFIFIFVSNFEPLATLLFGLSLLSFMFCLMSYIQIENSNSKKDLLVFGILSIFFGYILSGIFVLCAKEEVKEN